MDFLENKGKGICPRLRGLILKNKKVGKGEEKTRSVSALLGDKKEYIKRAKSGLRGVF